MYKLLHNARSKDKAQPGTFARIQQERETHSPTVKNAETLFNPSAQQFKERLKPLNAEIPPRYTSAYASVTIPISQVRLNYEQAHAESHNLHTTKISIVNEDKG